MVKEVIDEQQEEKGIEMLTAMMKKKQTSKKEKERKILDFKFRIMDLLELFITKSKNSQFFIHQFSQILNEVRIAQKLKNRQYLQKLLFLIKKFIEKIPDFQDQYQDDIQNCIQNSIYLISKIKQPNIQEIFCRVIFTLLKFKDEEYTQNLINSSLDKMCLKKNQLIPNIIFKEFTKQYPQLIINSYEKIIKYLNLKEDDGSINDYIRFELISTFIYMLQNKNTRNLIDVKKSKNELLELFFNIFSKQDQIKVRKHLTLTLYGTALNELVNINPELKKEFQQKIQKKVQSWDNNLENVQKRIIKIIN